MITEQNSLFLFIDVQEKLVAMLQKDKVKKQAGILAQAANILGIDCVVTEQYPAGLGATVPEIKMQLPENTSFVEKTSFNALDEMNVVEALKGKENIFVCGIETHVCVLQTVEALLENKYNVYVIQDACASRDSHEFKAGIKYMRHEGAKIFTTEMTLFKLLKGSKHPQFKQVQFLVK